MTELQARWLDTLQQVIDRAAHEVKDALNGVALNVEVVRSRSGKPDMAVAGVAPFAAAASDQLETLGRRVEALLFLVRPARTPVDVGVTLRHLGELLVPAAKADGGHLEVVQQRTGATTRADATATRLALATLLLANSGSGRRGKAVLEGSDTTDAVVRFSHESAGTCSFDPAIAALVAGEGIRSDRSASDLLLVFPGNS